MIALLHQYQTLTRRQRPTLVTAEICETRILVWPAHLDASGIAGIATCDRDLGHRTPFHEGPIDSHGLRTRISWLERDPRNFRGTYRPCSSTCSLPARHRGGHAL